MFNLNFFFFEFLNNLKFSCPSKFGIDWLCIRKCSLLTFYSFVFLCCMYYSKEKKT